MTAADAAVCQCGGTIRTEEWMRCSNSRCGDTRPVADVNRPDDTKTTGAGERTDGPFGRGIPFPSEQPVDATPAPVCHVGHTDSDQCDVGVCDTATPTDDGTFAAASDRGVGELADLLAAHGWRDNYDDGEYIGYICACRAPDSGPMDTDLARHVAAVLIAAGWQKR